MYKWICYKLKLQEKFERNNQIHANYPRGTIYACYMGMNIGHEKSRLEARPCLIVSSDETNKKRSKVIEEYEDLSERLDTAYTAVELYLFKDSVKDTTESYMENMVKLVGT